MPVNHVLLETINLTQTASSVTFDNIPQTGYSGLKIVVSSRGAQSGVAEANTIYFNGDTTTANYPGRRLLGSGSAPSSDQTTTIKPGFFNNLSSSTTSTFSNSEVYIPNYTGSNSKSYSVDTVTENNATEAYMALVSGRWTGTAAITSISFTPESGNNYAANSTFSLYGIAATGTTPVTAPKAQGGNIVANDGTYWYHAFLNSGTFTPLTSLTADMLVVAGGGGAILAGSGAGPDGGGGAGGLLAFTSQALTAQGYVVTVGAGGAFTTGNDSRFGTLTLVKGGGFGGNTDAQGGTGGSGGGSGGRFTSAGGAATSGQGNAGGVGAIQASLSAGGGGGAGAVGTNAPPAGAGGAGSSSYSSWGVTTSTGQNVGGTRWFAGGGGGQSWYGGAPAAGGNGGGGVAGSGTNGGGSGNGLANTGGGGGGDNMGSTGGSGIVIIRYAMA